MRSTMIFGLISVLIAMAIVTESGGPAAAQAQTAAPTHPRRPIPRITVVPLSRYHRQCDFWLAVEHRVSGDVITPQQHCWWALR